MTDAEEPRRRIAVLGGGISGLTAAYILARARQAGAPIEEFLIEARDRLGGLIQTEQVEGFVVEAGPDGFLTEKPEAASLCRELGLGDSLLGSNDRERRTYILHRGRLVPLPDGLQLFVPTRLWPLLTTPLLSLPNKLAILTEWFGNQEQAPSGRDAHSAPRQFAGRTDSGPRPPLRTPSDEQSQTEDESVASFVRRHFGRGMLENIADPLLAGIFGGDSDYLSVRSVLPRFCDMEQKYGSLMRAVLEAKRQRRKANRSAMGPSLKPAPAAQPPLFMTLREGLQQIVTQLRNHLESSRVHLGQRVLGIEPAPASLGRGYKIRCEGDATHEADSIIFTLPTYECGRLLFPLNPTLAGSLAAIPYTSALTVALGYDGGTSARLPSGFGFLVPRKEKRRLLACTFVHTKFSHRAPPGRALLRCFLGGSRDPEVLNLSDAEIVSIVRGELQSILSVSAEPEFIRIHRWPSSMPQYVLGHEERVNKIHRQIEHHPGLFLAGNAYSGIGIPDCIRTGKTAAERAL